MSYHGHSYFCQTSRENKHQHTLEGITSFVPDNKDHRHYIRGVAFGENGYSHSFYIQSSFEIPLESGGHTHSLSEILKDSGGHSHTIETELNPF